MSYTKVFPSMFTGSLYGAGVHVFATWTWVLANKDENGLVEVNTRLVAAELGAEIEQVERAIEYLTRPDPDSRSPESEGRRMVRVSQFGYQVVNHAKYADRGKDRSLYWRDYRAKRRATVAQQCAQVAQREITHVDVDVDVEEERTLSGKPDVSLSDCPKWTPEEEAFEHARNLYPGVKRGHDTEFRDFCRKHKDWRIVCPDLVPAIKLLMMERDAKTKRKEFIPEWAHFKTWLLQRRWEQAVNVHI
jgi:hypothetical protein